MAQPRPRHDAYGRPLPELADASQEVLAERERNQFYRRVLIQKVEELAQQLCRRGQHATVTLHWEVKDGMLQPHIDVEVVTHYRPEWEER